MDIGKTASITVRGLRDQFKLQFDNIATFSAGKDCRNKNTVNLAAGGI